MFVLQKQLTVLNIPSSRVAVLYRSGADIQLALPDLPSQMGSAFMVLLRGGGKVQVLVGLFMAKSCCNIFYISDSGEVPFEQAEMELEAGQTFAESMGFILNDSEFGRMTAEQQDVYWKSLPICQRQGEVVSKTKGPETKDPAVKIPDVKVSETKGSETKVHESKSVDVVLAVTPAPVKIDVQGKRKVLKEHLGKLLASL